MATQQVIESRERDLGGFVVRRVLPAADRQMVGPFIFFDHLGPTQFAPGFGIDVRPHPHIALATVTYLFAGSLEHRDSLGTVREIRPGDVNWMSAGSGIAHSERTPRAARVTGEYVHGIQSWVALPDGHEDGEPTFEHYPAAALPHACRSGRRIDRHCRARHLECARPWSRSGRLCTCTRSSRGARLSRCRPIMPSARSMWCRANSTPAMRR